MPEWPVDGALCCESSGFCARKEAKSQRVHAIAQTGGFGAVIEDVTEMRVAEGADDFVAAHSKTQIYFCGDVFFGDGRPEAGPAGSRVEFRIGAKERVGAADATVKAGVVVVVIGAAEGALGVGFARYVKFIRAERFAPVHVTFHHFGDCLDAEARSIVGESYDLH